MNYPYCKQCNMVVEDCGGEIVGWVEEPIIPTPDMFKLAIHALKESPRIWIADGIPEYTLKGHDRTIKWLEEQKLDYTNLD